MKIYLALLFVLAALEAVHSAASPTTDDCIENQARLLPGGTGLSTIVSGGDVRGLVQVCEGSRWKFICDDDWTSADATVACRDLGYGVAASSGTNYQMSSNILSYTLQCSGAEQNLSSCMMTTPNPGPCATSAVSCWNRSRDTITTAAITTTTTTSTMMLSTTSSSYMAAPLTSSSLHHHVQATPTSMKTAVLPLTSQPLPLTPQPPAGTSSTASPVASTTGPGIHNTATETAGLEPVVGALTGVAVVITLSTAVLAVCMMWRLAKSRRRHTPSASVEVRELGTNPTNQTAAHLISSSPNEAYAGTTVTTQPVHLYEDVM